MSLIFETPHLLDELQSAKLFNGAFVLSQLFGICAVLFVAIWMGGDGGFAWSDDPDRQFHYHPTFMAMGILFLQGEAILVYRVFRNERKKFTKLLHLSVHSVTLMLGLIALKAVWDAHDQKSQPNLMSLHSWIGLSLVVFYLLQYAIGMATFFFPGLSLGMRKFLLPFHQLFGILIFLGCSCTALLGISEYAAWHHRCWTVDHEMCAQHLVSNLFGLSLLGYCATVILLVANPRWKRKPLPEEECLHRLDDGGMEG